MINDILFESQMGNVDKYSKINIYSARQYPAQQNIMPHAVMPPPQHQDVSQLDAMSQISVGLSGAMSHRTENNSTEFHLGDYLTLH